MYDAASNGHLDVVKLLLDKGAIPSLKTDFGDTPLNVVQKWRAGTILTKDEETLYNNICHKIHNFIDKTAGSEICLNRSKSNTPVKPIKDTTPPSTSKLSTRIKELTSPVFKRRNIIDDDSDDEINISQNVRNQTAFPSDDSNDFSDDGIRKSEKDKSISVREYRSAISALRNRGIDLPEELDLKKANKSKSALLAPDEVDDDWLDDDLGTNKGKKRKFGDPLIVASKKSSFESIKDSIENINKIEPLMENNIDICSRHKRTRLSDVIDVSENSSDSDNFQRNENVSPKNYALESMSNIKRDLNESKSRDTRDSMRRRWKRQSTLLRAGFQRKRDNLDQSSNSGSDSEFNSRNVKYSTPSGKFSRNSSAENFKSNSNDGFNIVQNLNPNILQPLNMVQPINIVQSKNGKAMQTQILPPAAVKVHVEDKVFLISIKLDTINKLTISWLVEEVKSRYYK